MIQSQRRPRVFVHDGLSAEPLGEIADFTSLQAVWNEHEPAQLDMELPANSPNLHHTRWMPGHRRVFLRVDATDLGTTIDDQTIGAPEAWLGKVQTPQGNPATGVWSLGAVGPSSWAHMVHVPGSEDTRRPALKVAREIARLFPQLRVRMADGGHEGRGVDYKLGGQSVWSLWEELASGRGERFRLVADPDLVELEMHWLGALTGVRDRTDEIVLRADLDARNNVTWDPAYDIPEALEEMVGVSWSMFRGTDLESLALQAPSPVLGRQAALTAVLNSPLAAALNGTGPTKYAADIISREAMELALEAECREALTAHIMARAALTRITPALFSIRPLDVVSVRFANDPTGLFVRSTALVLSVTRQLWPSLAMDMSLELWSVDQ